MQKMESYIAERPSPLVEVHCEQLPAFDCTDCESVRRAFDSAMALPFQQAWLPQPEAVFSPGEVRLGWRGRSLMVFADMTDLDIFNDAAGSHQRLWETGDVFEMFFKSPDKKGYVEFQVSPLNQRLQFYFQDTGAVEQARKMGRFEDLIIHGDIFKSRTWIESRQNRWQVYAEIPAETIGGSPELIENSQWHFSFGRCDYTRGTKEPVISSTSRHALPDFHRQQEWDSLIFRTHL